MPQHLQTEEQRLASFEAAGLSQEQQGAVETGTALTSTDLETTPTLDFVDVEETAIFPVDQLETPELEPTPTETKAQTLTEEISALTEETLGVSEFTAEQREEFGVGALRTTQEDLVAQLKGFQIQAKSLALQKSLAGERIQQESIGRGRTAAGVAPLTAAAQRKITLQQADIAAQALTASALLSATEGKLVTARRQVEEAVAQKFAPILEELRVKEFNLNLILKSPDFSREQKNRAQAQKDAIANQKIEVEDARRTERELGQVLIQAASQNAPATLLEQARLTGDPIEATRIFAEAGFGEAEADVATVTGTPGKPLSINQIDIFRRTYGWTPPFGFTPEQLTQYMADNPNASPEELEAGARTIEGVEPDVETPTEPAFNALSAISEIMAVITDDQLKAIKKKADRAGISKVLRGKRKDVQAYLDSISDQIQAGLDGGLTIEQLIEGLTT